jgi:uncharacterized repeat protein (TIGR02543 family)
MPAKNVTLYAVWQENAKYTLTYDTNGGTGTAPDGGSYYADESITLASGFGLTLANYTFAGWSETQDGAAIAGPSYTMPAKNITLYAVWQPVQTTTYQVHFDANAAGDVVTDMPTDQTVASGSAVTIPSLIPLRPGYSFDGWRIGETTEIVDPDESFTPEGNVTLFAQWLQDQQQMFSLTVNVVPSEGGAVTGASTGQYTYLTSLTATAVPAAGYRFVQWELVTQASELTEMAAGTPFISTNNPLGFTVITNVDLTAVFAKLEDVPPPPPVETYTISYHPNGGTGMVPMDTHRYYYGEKATLLPGTGLHKGDLVWTGWEIRDGTGVTSPLTMPKNDVTLFAVYGPAIPSIPKTGDSAGSAGWLMILGALVLMAYVTARKRVSAK